MCARLEAALNVSDYTSKVDVIIYSSRVKRMVAQIKEMCSILSGLVVASDYKLGQQLFEDKDFAHNHLFFKNIFEIGRRYKIQNPDMMRGTYGKMMYMIMDSINPHVEEALGFNLKTPIQTVHSILADKDSLEILDDPMIAIATLEIIAQNKLRRQVQSEIKQKEKAIEFLAKKYHHPNLSVDDVRQVLYAIGDNNAWLRSNRDPVDNMTNYLTTFFSPDVEKHHLGIQAGRQGARLTHSHEKQFHYVHQSLTLWSLIMTDIYKLWWLSDSDLLSGGYRLLDTGQGLNRVQSCPSISRAMHKLIHDAQRKIAPRSWVGSSVVHLGEPQCSQRAHVH